MKANELRIGNYVDLYDNIATIQRADFSDCNCPIGIAVDKGNPIPLTEEWLYSFGFKWYGDWDAFVVNRESNKELSIIKSKGIFIVCDINLVPEIKHVHQLQNLYFALTGEELTIKN